MASIATNKAWGHLKSLKENLNNLREMFPGVDDVALLNLATVLVPGEEPSQVSAPVPAVTSTPAPVSEEHEETSLVPVGKEPPIKAKKGEKEETPAELTLRTIMTYFKDKEFTYKDLANKTWTNPRLMSGGVSVLSRRGLVKIVGKRDGINVWRLITP